jgi:hypothetical protein
MDIKYLPDYNEEYSIKLRPGLGVGSLQMQLQDGWNLTSVGMQTDQQTAQILGAVASIISAVRGGGAPAGGPSKTAVPKYGAMELCVEAQRDVPLGFYEPVIATDPHGRKCLFGWRYVGFMPFTGCPVEPCVQPNVVTCSPDELWGIIATSNSIKFQRLSDIRDCKQMGGYQTKPPEKK